MATTRTVQTARRILGIGGVVAAVTMVAATAVPAQAAGGSYVALGDSYSSGVGTRVYIDDGTSCERSVYA